jgi:SRSO17 transposase
MPSRSTPEERFEEFITILESSIGHADRSEPLRAYCTGLLLPGDRKSVEPMAARIDPAHVRQRHQSMHHFIADAPWSDRDVLGAIRRYALPRIEETDPIEAWIIDDTGMPKKGKHSVGVARQYCGQLGKQENCQVTVSLSLANAHASLPVAVQLYLPKTWTDDPDRCRRAGVPSDMTFKTKQEIALEQIQSMLDENVPRGIVLADAAYGNDHTFREQITARRLLYGVGIQKSTTVWPEETGPIPPPPKSGKRGQPRSLLRRDAEHQPRTVEALARSLPPQTWVTVRWREGTGRQPLQSRFAALRIRIAHRDYWRSSLRDQEWLLIEWPEGAEEPSHYWLLTLPPESSLRQLVHVVKMRWRIERDYEEMKNEIGLGHYEGRGWRGFHHHWSMCIAAYAFLAAERCLFPPEEKRVRLSLKEPGVPPMFKRRGSPTTA